MIALPNEFSLTIPSVGDDVRPATTMGSTVTPGNNAFGSWVELLAGAAVTHDSYGIWVNFNTGSTSATARDMLASVGVDPAGGTAYVDLIPNLLCSGCGEWATNVGGIGGISYYFPVFVKAGSSVAVRASVNNATVGTVSAWCKLYCKPSRPDLIRAGSFVQAFGVTLASSSGTVVTQATTAEGVFVELGTLDKTLWAWAVGVGINNAAATFNTSDADLNIGAAAAHRRLMRIVHIVDTSERCSQAEKIALAVGVSGDKVYGRIRGHNAANTGMSMMAYGVGG